MDGWVQPPGLGEGQMGRTRTSAGLVMYTGAGSTLQVLLVHPGGPLFARKDKGHWTIPKGEPDGGEELLDCARREFSEETGMVSIPPYIGLGSIVQKGGKVVHAWAFAWPDGKPVPPVRSTDFEMEWPRGSGRMARFPEVDRGEMMPLQTAALHLKASQLPLLDRLAAHLGVQGTKLAGTAPTDAGTP